jgi:pyruvate/2-oxoglutarate dehydrogenase complex dihydrolipoamide dehydrogenase (E3) component
VLGAEIRDGVIRVDVQQRTSLDGVFAAGECAGVGGVDVASVEGGIAGQTAVGIPASLSVLRRRDRLREWSGVLSRTFALRPELAMLADDGTIVCRCEDVTLRAIDSGRTAREAKLHSRIGMGACQGRVCGAAMRHLRGWDRDTVRTPLQPVPLSALIL